MFEAVDWKSKLSSRTFWVTIATFVTGLMVHFGGDGGGSAAEIGGLIMAIGSVIAYIFGEKWVDAAKMKQPVEVIELPLESADESQPEE